MNQERLEDLENIIDYFSIMISEANSKDLKEQLSEYQQEFIIEKEELETSLNVMQAEYEAECRYEYERMRI